MQMRFSMIWIVLMAIIGAKMQKISAVKTISQMRLRVLIPIVVVVFIREVGPFNSSKSLPETRITVNVCFCANA